MDPMLSPAQLHRDICEIRNCLYTLQSQVEDLNYRVNRVNPIQLNFDRPYGSELINMEIKTPDPYGGYYTTNQVVDPALFNTDSIHAERLMSIQTEQLGKITEHLLKVIDKLQKLDKEFLRDAMHDELNSMLEEIRQLSPSSIV